MDVADWGWSWEERRFLWVWPGHSFSSSVHVELLEKLHIDPFAVAGESEPVSLFSYVAAQRWAQAGVCPAVTLVEGLAVLWRNANSSSAENTNPKTWSVCSSSTRSIHTLCALFCSLHIYYRIQNWTSETYPKSLQTMNKISCLLLIACYFSTK